MLGDLPRDARHIRGFPRKDVLVGTEEVDERAFLFGGERGPDMDFFALGAAGSKRTSLEPSADSNDPVDFFASGASSTTFSLRVASSLEAMTAFDLALVSALEGGADGDDPMGTRHL